MLNTLDCSNLISCVFVIVFHAQLITFTFLKEANSSKLTEHENFKLEFRKKCSEIGLIVLCLFYYNLRK